MTQERRPLLLRMLRLHYLTPPSWLRTAFVVLPVVIAIVLWLADVASPWSILAAPLVVAVLLKVNDVLAGLLQLRG